MEHSPAWHELLRLDVQLLHGVTVQYVDAAPTVNQYTDANCCSSSTRGLGWQASRIKHFHDEAGCQKLCDLFTNNLLFSSDSPRRGCLTGFASSLTCILCSAKSFGTPGMSFGDHAKMSRFSWRKSMSSPSYLLSRFAPMTANLSGFSGSRGIFFISLAGWKEP